MPDAGSNYLNRPLRTLAEAQADRLAALEAAEAFYDGPIPADVRAAINASERALIRADRIEIAQRHLTGARALEAACRRLALRWLARRRTASHTDSLLGISSYDGAVYTARRDVAEWQRVRAQRRNAEAEIARVDAAAKRE